MNLNVFFLFHSNPGQPCHTVPLPCSTSTLALALTRVLALTLGQGTRGMIVLNMNNNARHGKVPVKGLDHGKSDTVCIHEMDVKETRN